MGCKKDAADDVLRLDEEVCGKGVSATTDCCIPAAAVLVVDAVVAVVEVPQCTW